MWFDMILAVVVLTTRAGKSILFLSVLVCGLQTVGKKKPVVDGAATPALVNFKVCRSIMAIIRRRFNISLPVSIAPVRFDRRAHGYSDSKA